jgi:hypothetical protein
MNVDNGFSDRLQPDIFIRLQVSVFGHTNFTSGQFNDP